MQPMLARQAPGRPVSSGVLSGGSGAKRTAGTASTSETLGSAAKLGQVGRDREREDVELKPPWELLPYCRDSSYGYPDFYPSKGKEEEYLLTEKAITEGFDNKPIVSNESGSSALDVGQSILEKPTHQHFSHFILSVLWQRYSDGLIKTPTTFRVPPRVTLTDQKREQYLRDLANPSQSLRRLARGVPHGIKGRQLLEQVCNKNVPINRAIWFIRVISVNELRAVKRKGLTKGTQESFESRWVIDWTGQVVAFLEAVMEESNKEKKVEDQERWRLRMTYTLRLVASLYAEQLIDQMTFLKWCLTYIEKSTIEVSPIVIILIGIYWDDLVARRATGRKLTELLLDKVDMILKSSKSTVLAPVVALISDKLQTILLQYPDYLILPKRWSALSPTLHKCLSSAPSEVQTIYESIQLRNANLSDPGMRPFLPDLEPPQARIVKLLDEISVPVNPSAVATQIYAITMELQLLMKTLCDYAVTKFRPGFRRIYLISNILSEWPFAEKLTVQDGILRYFENRITSTDEMQRLILLFTDLLERRVISYSWLLRRCIARGWTQNSDTKGYIRLLVELPIHNAPKSTQNTRDMILHRAQIESNTEQQLVEEIIDALANSGLPWLTEHEHMDIEPGANDFDTNELEWLKSSTRNGKSILATTITSRFVEAKAWESQGYPRQLQIVVRILSVIEEFRQLNNVLIVAIANNSRSDTLTTLITTVANWHAPLEGMGLLPLIIDSLALNWRTTFREARPNTHIINSLTHLHNHLASSNPTLAQLVEEFSQIPQLMPLTYPSGPSASPLSDHGLENLAIRDVGSAEEVFRLLTTTGLFDAALFQRVLTATAKECSFDIAGITAFLDLLKTSDVAQIDELAKEWAIEGIKAGVETDGTGVWWIVTNLIAVEFISIKDVIAQVAQMLSNPHSGKELSETQTLDLLFHVCTLVCSDSGTKLRLSLMNFLSLQLILHRISSDETCLQNLAILFRVLLSLAGHALDDIRVHVDTVTRTSWMLQTAIYHPDILLTHVVEPIVAMGDTPSLHLTISAFRALLGATDDMDSEFGENIEQIFKSTSEFSMNLCRINLSLVLEYSRLSNAAVGEKSGELVERIIASVVGQGQSGKSGDLVKSLNAESKQLLRDYLEKSFFEAAPLPSETLPDGQHPEIWSCEKIASAFKLLEATTPNSASEAGSSMDSRTVGKLLLEKARCIRSLLDVEDQPAPVSDFNELVFGTTTPPVPSQKELIHCFILCLRILVLRWAAIGVSESLDLEAWVTTLVDFMKHPRISKEKLLANYIYDIILCFYDELQSSPGINRLIALFESSRSPRLETFLPFKRQNAFFDNLVMVKPSNPMPSEIQAKVWDNIESATAAVTENDGPFSLGLFDARERCREHSLWEPEVIRVGIN